MRSSALIALTALLTLGCSGDDGLSERDASKEAVDAFLVSYAQKVRPAWLAWKTSAWEAHTRIREGDTEAAENAVEARDAYESVLANSEWTTQARTLVRTAEEQPFKEQEKQPPTAEQLAALKAIQDVTSRFQPRVTEARRRARLAHGALAHMRSQTIYMVDGEPIAPDALHAMWQQTRDLKQREAAWNAVLEPERELKSAFAQLRDARNDVARKLGQADHLSASFRRYDMDAEEMADWLRDVEVAVRPLYRELHTYLRYTLAEDFAVEDVPAQLPIHWLGMPLGENLSGTIELPALDPREGLRQRGSEQMLKDAAALFEGMGLPALPEEFWKNSSLYPRLADQRYAKLGGASTWNIDLKDDVRVLMSAQATPAWMDAAYRELAFVHAHYARLDARRPIVLRLADPDATIGALTIWAQIAGTRAERLDTLGLLGRDPGGPLDDLLADALLYLSALPFTAGTIPAFEREVYAESLPTDQLNTRWWALLQEHQGIVAPATRTERWADALHYTPLSEHPGSAAEQAIAIVTAWQLHVSVSESLGLDPRSASFTSNPEAGEVFKTIAAGAGIQPWRKLIEERTGAPPSADNMVRYFEPLYRWLQEQNDGRVYTLPRLK